MFVSRCIRCLVTRLAFVLAFALSASHADADGVWRHGIIEAKSDAGILMMVTRGFAEKQGLRLDIVQFKSDAIGLKALLAGEIQSYDGALTGTVVAASMGVDVKLIGCHWPGLPHGIFVRDTISSVADLKGKVFAISSPFSHPDMIARTMLARHEIPASDVRFASLGGDIERFRALAAGIVDATVISNEYVPVAAQNHMKLLVAGRDVMPHYMRLCMFSTARTLSDRADDAARFLAAEISALRYALAHRDETIKLTHDITGAKPDDPRAAYIFDDAVANGGVDPEIGMPVEKIEWMQAQLVRDGRLKKMFDLSRLIDGAPRAKALERLAGSSK